MVYRLLLVEDEENLLKNIKLNLELENYIVITCTNGKDAIKEFKNQRFDLVILDVMLPEISGFDVCQAIRLENKTIPILFLTAKGSSADKIKGLKLGADDYITKPFELEEFLLRVQILTKRGQNNLSPVFSEYTFGNNKINFSTFEISGVNNIQLTLTKKEIALLKLLIGLKNEVISREQILEKIWGYDVYPSTRTIDNYILAFRKYFEQNPKEPKHFHSIRGIGYKFTD